MPRCGLCEKQKIDVEKDTRSGVFDFLCLLVPSKTLRRCSAIILTKRDTQGTPHASLLNILILSLLISLAAGMRGSRAEEGGPATPVDQSNLTFQASAPLSSIMQIRLRDTYTPQFADLHGWGNVFAIDVTMPLPAYRLLPFRHLSLFTIPAAVTTPSGLTGFGDVRFVDIALLHEGDKFLWGLGPVFIFPTATDQTTGQGKWQAGPAAAAAVVTKRWLAGVFMLNPISFAGNHERSTVSYMVLQPFVTYQLGDGWFVRSQPQMFFDWKTGNNILPLDLGVGRTFKIGQQDVSCFIEPFWNIASGGNAPRYGFTAGFSLLYPNFWQRKD